AAGKYDLRGAAAEQCGHGFARSLDRGPRLLPMMVDGRSVPKALAKVRPHGLQHLGEHRSSRVVVEIDPSHHAAFYCTDVVPTFGRIGLAVRRAWPGMAHSVQFLLCLCRWRTCGLQQNSQKFTEKFMKTRLLIFGLMLALATPLALADEGMWLYNNFPKDRVEKQYGFLPTQEWLDHLQLSSVRFNNGGSGSFVSADGLAFTNHHIGADCIEKLGTSGADYMKTSFYAKTRADEAKCPDLELNVLVGINDVTAKVKAAAPATMSAAAAGQAQRSAMSAIEKDCATSTGLRCDVVTLYSGEVYDLYKYKKYTDMRLVFAPEYDAAFFGGDPDNFTYPRYDLDIYLQWSKVGVKDGDLIFVSGHPGHTDRLDTVAQLQFLKSVDYPSRLASYKRRIDMLQKFSAESAENARIAQEDIFGLQNSQKAINGELEGLQDMAVLAQMSTAEREREKAYMDKHAGEPNPWEQISD